MELTGTQKRIKFQPQQEQSFYAVLRKRVDAYFESQHQTKHATPEMVVKSAIFLSAYILPFFILPFAPVVIQFFLWAIMGIAIAGIGMSVMHDANHGAYSSNARINYWMGHTLNLLGGSAHNWKLQHNILHHTYTNITYVDEDIQDRLVLKFSPHTPVKFFHQYQWIYAFLFYGLITLYWVFAKDFVQHVQFIRSGVNNNSKSKNNIVLLKIIGIKVIYLMTVIGVPVIIWNMPVLHVILGFTIMHFIAGIILTTVFQLAHTVEHTHHPMPDEQGIIHNEWAIHQLETTVNFSKNNKWLSWYVGGLNYQIEHHLFPKISHVHYPAISQIVRQTAAEFQLPYMENQSFGSALRSHINYLKTLGTPVPDFNNALG